VFSRFSARPDLHGAIDEHERHRLELIIGTARAFLAGIALITISLDPSEPTRYADLAYNLLIFYDIHSAVILLLFRFGPIRAARLGPFLHAIDLAWAVAITFLTEGPNSSYFALFVFVLLAAAYRWGFRQTLLTGIVAVFLFLLEAVAVSVGMVSAILELQTLIMRSAYFVLATFLLAYLSEQAKGLRAEASVINRLTEKINVREGRAANMRVVLADLLKVFGSREASIVLEERSNARAVLWEAVLDNSTLDAKVRFAELDIAQRSHLLFPLPSDVTVWEVHRKQKRSKDKVEWIALDREGKPVPVVNMELPSALKRDDWKTVVGLTVGFSNDWIGRLFLFDPTARPMGERRLRFLQGVMTHVTPVLHNVFLLRRLRLRVGTIERARVARELHDSVIQSLIGVEMQLDVTRRDSALSSEISGKLTVIQGLLRQEILNIRDLMEQLRRRPADSKHLVDQLRDLADRFRRETGIDVRLRSDMGEFKLAPRLCHEVTRIVQEALINIRKHSSASNVTVELRVDDWAWRLIISDDGRGFGFVGTVPHSELGARRVGPRTIRERVEAVGAKLQLRSGPQGARLEIVGRTMKPWIVTSSA
jgi:signal transduction histidine kinase